MTEIKTPTWESKFPKEKLGKLEDRKQFLENKNKTFSNAKVKVLIEKSTEL